MSNQSKENQMKTILRGEKSSKIVNSLFFDAHFDFIAVNTKIKVNNQIIGEIDGIWKCENIILIIEATEQKKKLSQKISHFFAKWNDPDNLNRIKELYNLSREVNFIRIFFDLTRNTPVGKLSRRHSQIAGKNIMMYSDDFDYFMKQINLIGRHTKYDILSFLGVERTDKSKQIPAIKIKIGRYNAIVFSITAKLALETCYVARRIKNDGYQRAINPRRINDIRTKITNKSTVTFPNSIIVTPSDKNFFKNLFEKNLKKAEYAKIHLPTSYLSFRVVDGQHRLLGFSKLPDTFLKEYDLIIVCITGLDGKNEVELFSEINLNAISADKSLILNLKADYKYKPKDKFYNSKIAIEVCKLLNNDSFLENRIYFGEAYEVKKEKPITLNTLVNQLSKYRIVGKDCIFNISHKDIEKQHKKTKNLLQYLITLNSKTKKLLIDPKGIRLYFRLIYLAQRNIQKKYFQRKMPGFIKDLSLYFNKKNISEVFVYSGEQGTNEITKIIISKLREIHKPFYDDFKSELIQLR